MIMPKVYEEPSQSSKMELFLKLVNGLKWLGSEYASVWGKRNTLLVFNFG